MTHISGTARDIELVTRWRKLAEKRLDYLSALYESGRWRIYHTEQAFVDNIRDAKLAVEAWRLLAKSDDVTAPDIAAASAIPQSSASLLPQATLTQG